MKRYLSELGESKLKEVIDEHWKIRAMLAFQFKKMPSELSIYKVSEMADALKSLEYAWKEIEKRTPEMPKG